MNWSVDNLQITVTFIHLRTKRECIDVLDIFVVEFFTNNLYKVGVALKLDLAHILNVINIVDNVNIVRRHHLSTVIPIGLVAVILLGIVRSSDIYTTLAAQQANTIRHLRSRTWSLKKINLDAIGTEYIGNSFGK